MASIRVPSYALPGFRALLELESVQLEQLLSYIGKMSVGTTPRQIDQYLQKNINVKQSAEIVQTLISFSELLAPAKVDFEDLSEKLANAYNRQSEAQLKEKDLTRLSEILLKLFKSSKSLKFTLKAIDLVRDDDYIFSECKVISDIRLVFNDELEEGERNAIMIHRLLINYIKDDSNKKISLLLDMQDLRKLKAIIDRALTKEDLIKKDYTSINFINLSHDV